jgi:NAD(P)H-dependent flavin oxidoreductase YrpB (nitropropane dioxygenase family)
MFNSRHPIVCAPMNGVSDLKLALACAQAGIVPSLIPYNYKDFNQFFIDLSTYKNITHSDIIIALRLDEVVDDRLHNKLMRSGITHIELLEFTESDLTDNNINKIQSIRNSGIKIILKVLTHNDISAYKNTIDAVTIKSNESAGRSEEGIDLISEIKTISSLYPNIKIIASGGVKNNTDLRLLLNEGATAVGIGTLFAMSKESSIPIHVKTKLLQKSSEDITRLKNGAQQRAVIFEEKSSDDFNNTIGLNTGLQTGTSGHIFVGNAIDTITDILSVQDIVNYLTV